MWPTEKLPVTDLTDRLFGLGSNHEEEAHQFASPVQHNVDDLLADGVVASGVVVGCVLLPSDQLLGVEELAVGPCTHLIYRDIALVGYTNLCLRIEHQQIKFTANGKPVFFKHKC